MPKGLYARSLLIIITPIVILQAVVAYVFMEKHWQSVTARLSAATTKDIAAIIELYETSPHNKETTETLERVAQQQLDLSIEFRPLEDLPRPGPKPFFSILDQALSTEITQRIALPFWIDTVGRSDFVEIRIKLDDAVLRVFARRNQTYASNSHIFLVWMVGSSLVLMGVAILFLRNQIRPIQQLATAAEAFGKGRDVENFRPRGAREVRQAAAAFIEMRRRVERAIEQRTTMLNGVSHDLRTILTRFKLSLAVMDAGCRDRRASKGRRRDEPHAGGLSRLRAGRCRRAGRRRPTSPRCSSNCAPTRSATATRPRCRSTATRSPSCGPTPSSAA